MQRTITIDWLLRFVKGIFIGSGFILPGVSGGALAAVFGIYERLITFIAHITRDFVKNLKFFIPVGLGMGFGIVIFSFAVSYFLGNYEVQILWFFIGAIVGTMPVLWKQAGKQGRQSRHWIIMAITAVLGYVMLRYGESFVQGSVPTDSFTTWILAGVLMGLGAVVPGMSPSNFLVYLNLYKPMTDGIKSGNFGVIIPIILGAALCVLCFSKLMDYILGRAYAGLYHFIMGIVVASTVMIVPLGYDYLSGGALLLPVIFAAGLFLGLWMGKLEEKYK